MDRTQGIAINRILSDGAGFEWDVEVPALDPPYPAATILSLVKLVSRRGRVRYFVWYRGATKPSQWVRDPHGEIKGQDDLATYVEDALREQARGHRFIISFEDRNEARTFARDLHNLASATIDPNEAEQRRQEMEARKRVAADYSIDRYLVGAEHRRYHCGSLREHRMFVEPKLRDAREVDAWMRRHIEYHHRVSWWAGGLELPRSVKFGNRYYRLTTDQWQQAIDQSGDANHLIVLFWNEGDREKFDRKYGPGQFLHI